jgi:predicted GIY-YIG superfamily endonuclease
MISIYTISDSKNDIIYVGRTNNLSRRWNRHKQNAKSYQFPLYKIWRSLNDNFKMDVIETCHTLEEAKFSERYWNFIYKPIGNKQYPMRTRPEYRKTIKHCFTCHRDIIMNNFSTHLKTKKHKNNLL